MSSQTPESGDGRDQTGDDASMRRWIVIAAILVVLAFAIAVLVAFLTQPG